MRYFPEASGKRMFSRGFWEIFPQPSEKVASEMWATGKGPISFQRWFDMNICAQIISYVMTNLSDDSNLQEETTKSLPKVNFGDSSYVLLNFSFQGFNCQSFCRRLFLKTFCLFSFYKSLNRIPFRNEFIISEFPISKIASCSPVALLTLLGDRATAFNLP